MGLTPGLMPGLASAFVGPVTSVSSGPTSEGLGAGDSFSMGLTPGLMPGLAFAFGGPPSSGPTSEGSRAGDGFATAGLTSTLMIAFAFGGFIWSLPTSAVLLVQWDTSRATSLRSYTGGSSCSR